MRKHILYFVICVVLAAAVLAGCGRLSQKTGSKSGSGTSAASSTDSSVQGSAQDIEKMLGGIQSDSASIVTGDTSGSDSTDSAINEINNALNGSQDDITGINQ